MAFAAKPVSYTHLESHRYGIFQLGTSHFDDMRKLTSFLPESLYQPVSYTHLIEGVAGNPLVYTSTSIMELTELPRRLVIIGGGYIGLEFASMYASFSSG